MEFYESPGARWGGVREVSRGPAGLWGNALGAFYSINNTGQLSRQEKKSFRAIAV